MVWPIIREWHVFIYMVDLEKEQIRRFLHLVGRRHNRIHNSIRINVKTPKGNEFILIIFIYLLDIYNYESL